MRLSALLCCFNSKTAIYLEKTNLVITTIGLILDIFKLCIIPWGATSYTMEFFAVLTFVFLSINLVMVFFFFLLRLKNMINDHNYRNCFYICCIMGSLSILNFIFEFIMLFQILDDLYYYTGTYYASTNEVVVSDGEWFIAFFTIAPSVMFWFVILMLWASECIRVVIKTYGSYDEYIQDNTEVVIISKGGKNKVDAYDQKGKKIEDKGKDVSIKQKNISTVSITYA